MRALAFLLLSTACALAQDAPTVFSSKSAKDAVAEYEKNVSGLTKSFQDYHAEALKILIGRLGEARRKALEANDLDEAQRCALRIKEAEDAQPADPKKGPVKGFDVIGAYWGAQGSWINVTPNVQAYVRGGRLVIPLVESALRAPDPAKGVFKSLVIVYAVNGKVETAIFPWDGRVQLPK